MFQGAHFASVAAMEWMNGQAWLADSWVTGFANKATST